MFYHGFENYLEYAFPEDELRPLHDPRHPLHALAPADPPHTFSAEADVLAVEREMYQAGVHRIME